MERRIKTFGLFKDTAINAGTSGISGPIDLRDIADNGYFSLSYSVGKVGTSTTAGTVTFEYLGCPVYDGTYVAPTGSLFGTQSGTAGGSDIIPLTPPVIPFIKIRANVGTSCSASVTAQLHVQ